MSSATAALTLDALLAQGQAVPGHAPWRRANVDAKAWSAAVAALVRGKLALLSLWADADTVHMALLEADASAAAVVSLQCRRGSYPSVGQHHPPAIRLERAVRDLFGLTPKGLPDERPWLDHGRWPASHPLAAHPATSVAMSYPFLPSEGESLHQIAVGPVHAGIIEPGHFRFTANGEAVVRLEERLGYVHKGVDALMAGADPERAARLAGRVSGDSTVAYQYAFALAFESALGTAAPPRAAFLRALMAELERLANHLGDIGAICNDASFPLLHMHCGVLRERLLRAADAAFGHRLMRDGIVPGGVAGDVSADGIEAIRTAAVQIGQRFPELVDVYDNTASLQDRTVSTGVLDPVLASQYAAGGFVGRASGRRFDARRSLAYAPYDALRFDVPVLTEGDVNARVWIRVREVQQSLSLVDQLLAGLPGGETRVPIPAAGAAREGMALVEAFRGDVLVWLRIGEDGAVERCHLRDASWFQWPLLEAAIEGNIVADFPLCNKSFNCSYSGHDL